LFPNRPSHICERMLPLNHRFARALLRTRRGHRFRGSLFRLVGPRVNDRLLIEGMVVMQRGYKAGRSGRAWRKPSMRLSRNRRPLLTSRVSTTSTWCRTPILPRSKSASAKSISRQESAERRRIDLDKALGRDAFNLDRILEAEPAFRSENHEHDDEIGGLPLQLAQPVKPENSSLGSMLSSDALAPTSGSQSALRHPISGQQAKFGPASGCSRIAGDFGRFGENDMEMARQRSSILKEGLHAVRS
jgi:hypothetical protein